VREPLEGSLPILGHQLKSTKRLAVTVLSLTSLLFHYKGVLAGFVLGEALGCFIGFGWAKFTVRRLLRAGY